MFLGIQDFDFFPNLIKFYLNFTQIGLKTLLGDTAASSASPAPMPLRFIIISSFDSIDILIFAIK